MFKQETEDEAGAERSRGGRGNSSVQGRGGRTGGRGGRHWTESGSREKVPAGIDGEVITELT